MIYCFKLCSYFC